ncbi:thymidylate kinase, putative, partial [Eimeria tenella]
METEEEKLEPPKRGVFIVFEGLDRSGKSTQAKMLFEKLSRDGVKAKLIRFPERSSAVGSLIDAALQQAAAVEPHVLHLLFAANRWEQQQQIEKWLAAGFAVVADRFLAAAAAAGTCAAAVGVVYSTTAANHRAAAAAAAAPESGGPVGAPVPISEAFARSTEKGLLAPDRVYFLDIKPEEAAKREGF